MPGLRGCTQPQRAQSEDPLQQEHQGAGAEGQVPGAALTAEGQDSWCVRDPASAVSTCLDMRIPPGQPDIPCVSLCLSSMPKDIPVLGHAGSLQDCFSQNYLRSANRTRVTPLSSVALWVLHMCLTRPVVPAEWLEMRKGRGMEECKLYGRCPGVLPLPLPTEPFQWRGLPDIVDPSSVSRPFAHIKFPVVPASGALVPDSDLGPVRPFTGPLPDQRDLAQ